MDDKRKSYHNINTKADKAVIRVRLGRPPGWCKGLGVKVIVIDLVLLEKVKVIVIN